MQAAPTRSRCTYNDFNGCTNSITRNFSTYADPTLDFTFNRPDYTDCNGIISIQITPSVVDPTGPFNPNRGYFSVFSSTGDFITQFANGQTTFNVSSALLIPGTYQIRYTYQNAVLCAPRFVEKTVTINPAPNVSFSGLGNQYCVSNPQVPLSASLPGGVFQIRKVSPLPADPSFQNMAGNNFNPTLPQGVAITSSTTYEIRYVFVQNGCPYASPISIVTVNPLPVLSFTLPKTSFCEDEGTVNIQPSWTGGIIVPANGSFTLTKGGFNQTILATPGSNPYSFNLNTLVGAGGYGIYTISYTYQDESSYQ